jgi:hypothetical protein
VLLDLARYRPSNFGISTSILMHMIRYITHSPIAKQKHLREALRDIQFQTTMNDCGMFFLHDLDLDNHYIKEIPAVDPDGCKTAMSKRGKIPKEVRPIPVHPSSTPSGHYPLGDAPSWVEIKAFIGRGAEEFMHQWVWNHIWDTENATAARLFTRFTREFFATLKTDALRADTPSPTCLEDAMMLWTVRRLSTTIVSCWFIASNHGLQGKISGARTLGFQELARVFFPAETEHAKNSAWAPFYQHGYLWDYLHTLEGLEDEEKDLLSDAIAAIFGRLHCLPVVLAPSQRSGGKLWTNSQEGIHFLTNPIFYKLKRVGSTKPSAKNISTRLQRVKASNAVISRRLIKMNGDNSPSHANAKRARMMARNRMARRSAKTKNRRVPPNRWGKKKESPAPESSEEESSEEADEEDKDEQDESDEESDEEDDNEQDELDEEVDEEDENEQDEFDEDADGEDEDELDGMDVDEDEDN